MVGIPPIKMVIRGMVDYCYTNISKAMLDDRSTESTDITGTDLTVLGSDV